MVGQWPWKDIRTFHVQGTTSWFFPEHLDTSALYPAVSSIYAHADGTTAEVPCFVPGEVGAIPQIECPAPFVNPISEDMGGCIQACPVQAYTDGEYTVMWSVSNGIGLIGLFLNLFMACTWLIAGKEHFDSQPYQLKSCIFTGILFSLVGTLPSLVLKYDLPCECETEEW